MFNQTLEEYVNMYGKETANLAAELDHHFQRIWVFAYRDKDIREEHSEENKQKTIDRLSNAVRNNFPEKQGVTKDQVSELQHCGILDTSGRIISSCLPAFETLATTKTLTNLLFFDGSKIIEYTCYFSQDSENKVAITDTDEGLFLEYPAQIDGFVDFLKELTGDSSLCNMSYENEFDVHEAYIFATLIDL